MNQDYTKHLTVAELLPLLGGEISAAEASEFESHILVCEQCRLLKQNVQEGLARFDSWDLSVRAELIWIAEAERYERDGQLDMAIVALQALVGRRRKQQALGEPITSLALGRMAKMHQSLGEVDQAERCLLEALDIRSRISDDADSNRVDLLNDLADLYFEAGDIDRAGDILDQIEEVITSPPRRLPDATTAFEAPAAPAAADAVNEAQLLEQSLKEAAAAETRPKFKAFLQRWLRDFEGKVEGAFRLVTNEGRIAVQEVTELLMPDLNWRLGDLGLVTLGSPPTIAPEQPSLEFKPPLYRCVAGKLFEEQAARIEIDTETNTATVEFPATPGVAGFGVLMIVPGQRVRDRFELCQPVQDPERGEILRAVFTDVPDPDRNPTFVVREERGGNRE